MVLAAFMISLFASVAGAICGVGGGIIIKPVCDLLGIASVVTISFLSGCTVLSMSAYSVAKSFLTNDKLVDLKVGTPIAIGATIGGIIGKRVFQLLVAAQGMGGKFAGGIQALCLFVVTFLTILYTIKKDRIHTHHINNPVLILIIGATLGILSSFLGIGGGPINLMVLNYFFSMKTKVSAANSLYIIVFSQLSSLVLTIFTRTVPEFEILMLVLMIAGGIGGGIIGRRINKEMEASKIDRLFIGLMILIMLICLYNAGKAFAA